MDRLAIHPPRRNQKPLSNKNSTNDSSRYGSLFNTSSAVFVIAAASAAVFRYSDSHGKPSPSTSASNQWLIDTMSSYNIVFFGNAAPYSLVVLLIFLLATIALLFLTNNGKANLIEAALEITPLGVQLVSTFENGESNNNGKSSIKTPRAFIPRHRILDVIVMEVVWPHCVWTQVAFRVVNEAHCGRSHRDPDPQTEQSEPESVEELLRHGRVSIIPAFPEECRGWLTYRECLVVQSELERLLGIPSS